MSHKNPQLRSYWVEGWEILIGKTDRDNDALSIHVGKPADFWFHVAGMPGSHVVARHPDRPEQIPREVKRVSAAFAAFFSKAKNGKNVAVHWTTCKNVSKRRGSPAGQVQLKKYQSIKVTPLDPKDYFGGA